MQYFQNLQNIVAEVKIIEKLIGCSDDSAALLEQCLKLIQNYPILQDRSINAGTLVELFESKDSEFLQTQERFKFECLDKASVLTARAFID